MDSAERFRFAAFDMPYDIVYRTHTLKGPDYIILHSYGKSIFPEPGVRLCMTWYAIEGTYSQDEGTYDSVLNQTFNRRYGFDEGDRLIRAVAEIIVKNFSSDSAPGSHRITSRLLHLRKNLRNGWPKHSRRLI